MKSYNTITNVFHMAQDDSPFSEWIIDESDYTTFLDDHVIPYVKVSKTCDRVLDCIAAEYKYLDGSKFSDFGEIYSANPKTIQLSDGSVMFQYGNVIFIDTNGKKEPNTFGIDAFLFALKERKGCFMAGLCENGGGYDGVEPQKCLESSGMYGCATKMLQEGKMDYWLGDGASVSSGDSSGYGGYGYGY